MVSSNFPNRPFRLEEQVDTTTFYSENRSAARGRMWIRKNSYSPSFSLNPVSAFAFSLDGVQRASGNFGYDFRGSDELLLCDVYADQFYHDANGNRYFSIQGSANVDQMGYAQVDSGIQLPRIPKPPQAPTPLGIDQITSSSMRYRFSGNGDGGSPIRRWEVQAWGEPTFTNAGIVTSDGTYYANNLPPGYRVYFRSRGVNDYGAGPWSSVIDATTLGTAPSAPKNVAAVITPPNQVDVTWAAPDSVGGKNITSYDVQLSASSDFVTGVTTQIYTDPNTRSAVFRGDDQLAPGSTFWIRVRAVNPDAFGTWATVGPFIMPAGGKAWTGTAWKVTLWKVWNGTLWKIGRVKVWNGDTWKAAK